MSYTSKISASYGDNDLCLCATERIGNNRRKNRIRETLRVFIKMTVRDAIIVTIWCATQSAEMLPN